MKVIQSIGRINGNEFDNIFMELSNGNHTEESRAHISDLFARRNMRNNILLIILVW